MLYKGFIWVQVAQGEDHWWFFCKRELNFGINKKRKFVELLIGSSRRTVPQGVN
jgi:hypothetical protein